MVRFALKRFVCGGLLLAGLGTLAHGDNANSALQQLQNAFKTMGTLEPLREGPLHDLVRGGSVIKHDPSPAVRFVEPLDGATFQGYLAVDIVNWVVDPSRAVNAGTQFANGHQERNIGHTHVWILKMENNMEVRAPVVRFTGATGLQYNDDTGRYESAGFALDPGTYKAYVQLQNNDHTGAVPAVAPAFPGIASVIFTVPGAS